MRKRYLSTFVSATLTLLAGAQTYNLCDFWPLAVGNRWEHGGGVLPMEVVDASTYKGLNVVRLRDANVIGDLPSSPPYIETLVEIGPVGWVGLQSLEDIDNGLAGTAPAIPSTFIDEGIYPFADYSLQIRVGSVAYIYALLHASADNSPVPSETLCVLIEGIKNNQSFPIVALAQGYGPVYSGGVMQPVLVDPSTCFTNVSPSPHRADADRDNALSLSELLRLVQLFNSGEFDCDATSEDGFRPGEHADTHPCFPHSADYNPQDWVISMSELLRAIQLFNAGGYHACPDAGTEDGFCLGAA